MLSSGKPLNIAWSYLDLVGIHVSLLYYPIPCQINKVVSKINAVHDGDVGCNIIEYKTWKGGILIGYVFYGMLINACIHANTASIGIKKQNE